MDGAFILAIMQFVFAGFPTTKTCEIKSINKELLGNHQNIYIIHKCFQRTSFSLFLEETVL